ncbi:F0F1 ATP synthase subunit epsilon [Hwanghaeella grinnelliae]|uniref:ATP synthase epsilon chain n=1 Tax=Hwanghaeella grinnelliae TaxID=2500179 RepID=A0A437QMT6_9PROT|nr:F0F1 ATP synthase subunit epsilon [Hwanghaeella grinnelliae]RVU35817.1 F0F1 ATP synthase subunit epsilon [Hwanghaeella grinnelliae]
MRLVVTTPTAVIVDRQDVRYVSAEDETGTFGILPGHADFMTVLTVSVITWRNDAEQDHFIAVRGGVLTVQDGATIEVATRDAVSDQTLGKLDDSILERFRQDEEAEEQTRVSTTRLHLATIRQVQHYLQAGRQGKGRRILPSEGTQDGPEGV